MAHAFDLEGCDCGTGNARKKHAAQRIPQSHTIAAMQWLDAKGAAR
jgi:hypothetical protein